MSTLNDVCASPHSRRNVLVAKSGWHICAFVLSLFVLAATLSAIRKDVTRGFDEVAHASYVAHLQHSGETWPAFADMRMLDPSTFRFTGQANYLDHHSPYYLLLAWIGPDLEDHPQAIIIHRLINVALGAIGLTALMAIGIMANLPRLTLYAYLVPLACIPVLAPLAGAINNDNAAFGGGGIATLAAYQLLVTGRRGWLMAALAGVILASWAKFTALLLTGGLIAGVSLWLLWQGRLQPRSIVLIAVAMLVAAAPYIALLAQYGSPTPRTAGQIAMIKAGAIAVGWDGAERMPALRFAAHFLSEFVLEWIPTLKPRNALNYAALAIPIVTVLCAFAGIFVSARRIAQQQPASLHVLIVALGLAFATTFLVHGIYAYRLHTEFGWLTSAYPRYYLPLAALVPLAGLASLEAVKQPSARAILLVFLIAGPVLLCITGTPLG
jgi:hypothetical protein